MSSLYCPGKPHVTAAIWPCIIMFIDIVGRVDCQNWVVKLSCNANCSISTLQFSVLYTVTRFMYSYSTPVPVNTWTGDRLRVGTLPGT